MQDPPRPATGYRYLYPDPLQQPGDGRVTGIDSAAQPNPHATLIRRVCILLLIILALSIFILIIIASPPLPKVYINSLSVSNFNVSNNQVTGKWDLQLQFRNPNSKMSLYYNSVFCSLFYHRDSLSDTRLQPFDQSRKDRTLINATLSVSGTYIESRLADSIAKERAAKGILKFDLRMASSVTSLYGVDWRRRTLTFQCDDVAVSVPANSSSGKMVDSSKRCRSY